MDLNTYKENLLKAQSDDWTIIGCWGAGSGPSYRNAISVWTKSSGEFHNIEVESHAEVYSLKSDLRISVSIGITHNDDFVESWANQFTDSKASSSFVDFFFCNQLVYRDIYVAVDGGRCMLPLPKIHVNKTTHKIDRLTVSREKYEFFKLLNRLTDYEHYFSQTEIEIVDEPWMV
ncbi:TPA: hypothetical protein ACX6QU_003366 [Photobacterium damselae]